MPREARESATTARAEVSLLPSARLISPHRQRAALSCRYLLTGLLSDIDPAKRDQELCRRAHLPLFPSSAMQPAQPSPILVLDNGAHTIKAAWAQPGAGPSATPPCVHSRLRPPPRSPRGDELTARRSPLRWTSSSARRVVQTYRNTIARSKTAKRSFVGDELTDECDDFGGLTFRVPMERVRQPLTALLILMCALEAVGNGQAAGRRRGRPSSRGGGAGPRRAPPACTSHRGGKRAALRWGTA